VLTLNGNSFAALTGYIRNNAVCSFLAGAVVHYYRCAGGSQALCNRRANTLRCTRYHSHFTF
jgi:hypothetical protein